MNYHLFQDTGTRHDTPMIQGYSQLVRPSHILSFVVGLVLWLTASTSRAQPIRVPEDARTIQAAIDAAADGDTVIIAPGIYRETLTIRAKKVVLGSYYLKTGDSLDVARTIIDGEGSDGAVLHIENTEMDGTAIVGLTIQGANDGILANGYFQFLHSRITGCKDGIDYEAGSGGLVQFSIFEENRDDGIDLDQDVDIRIVDNIIRRNDNDGIEVRLHPYTGPVLNYVISRNLIAENGEDGIQIIDYPEHSDRQFTIEGNTFRDNVMAGIGCMSDGETREDYRAALIPEPIHLADNVFSGNEREISCEGLNERRNAR